MVLLISCEKDAYKVTISLQNNTNDDLYVTLYPNDEYRKNENLYSYDLNRTAAYVPTSFEMDSTNFRQPLIVTDTVHNDPIDLVNEVFDSIIVVFKSLGNEKILFTKDSAINYNYNLFSDAEQWDLETVEYPGPEVISLTKYNIINDNYYFSIESAELN